MRSRLVQLTGIVLTIGVSLAACSKGNNSGQDSAGAKKADVIVVAMEAEPPNMDPQQYSGTHNARVLWRVFEGLVRFKVDTTDVEPALAESWETSPDGLVYTFKLRKDVKFHDGTDFNAEAVKYTFERPIVKEHPNYNDGKWTFVTTQLSSIKQVDAVDSHTVKLTLKAPHAALLSRLADASAVIISPTAAKASGKDFASKPVGTGPYVFKTWERGNNITIARNEQYWGEKGKASQLVYRFLIEPQSRMNELLTGNADVAIALPPDFIDQLKQNKDVTVVQQPGIHHWYIGMNQDVKPLDNKLVRQAIAHAINKQAIIKDILRGTAVEGFSPIQPGTWGHNPDVKKYEYSLEKSKALLAQAGFPNGIELNLWVPESGSGMQSPKEMATVIQADLAKAGIKTKITTMEWTTYLASLNKGTDHALFVNSWMPGAEDPDLTFNFLHHSSKIPFPNRAHWRNPAADALITKGAAEVKREERVKIYKELQAIIAEEVPYIVVDHDIQTVVVRSNVKGLKLNPSYDVRLNTVYHEQ